MSWTSQETWLVACTILSIACIVLLISYCKVHAFIALLLGSLIVGLASDLRAPDVIKQFQSGFGSTLGSVGILVALGTMLGKLLAESGGADRIVSTIVESSGERRLPWAMALIAMVIGVPLFFEVGVVLLMPVIVLMTRRSGGSIVRVGIPALAGLSAMHGLVPPHPGPLIAVDALHADLGQTMAFGLLVAIPSVILAGPLFGGWIGSRVQAQAPERLAEELSARTSEPPGFGPTLGTIVLPVLLMLGKASVDVLLPKEHALRATLDFLGDPLMALLIAVLVAMFSFGYLRGFSREKVGALLGSSLGPIAGIAMIIGAGGGFKQLLIASGIGTAIGKAAATSAVSPLVLGWSIAVAIRLATGSATVATVTAAGLMAPIAQNLAPGSAPLIALAIGAGSLFFSHVNDAGFWLVKEYFGMTVGETIKTWSAMETILSLAGLLWVLLLSVLL